MSANFTAMASGVFQITIAILLIWFVYRVIARMLGLSRTTEAEPPVEPANVPARLKPRPRSGAGAIAVAEPDEEKE